MPVEVNEEKARLLRERQGVLTSLANSEGWKALKEIFETRKQAHLKTVAADLLSDKEVDQRKLDQIRGWWLGCTWLLANPEMAEASLKKALVAARLMEDDGNS